MKNTIYAVVAASVAMLVTSGVVALATAAPQSPGVLPDVLRDVSAEEYVGEMLASHYEEVVERQLPMPRR